MMNRPGIEGIFDKFIEWWFWCWYGIADKVRLWIARFPRYKVSGNLVSIIMPTLGRDLTKAIQSVLNQTHTNWELIIIKDGFEGSFYIHTPTTEKLMKIWDDKRIRRFCIPKKIHYPTNDPIYQWLVGPVNAINYGLSKVRGAWIARIDDDDEWEPWHLQTAFQTAVLANMEFVSFDIDLNGEVPVVYPLHGKMIGAVQTWLYRSYLNCFKCSKHSWRWRPGVNDVALSKRMARAGIKMYYSKQFHARIKPRPGLKNVGSKGWREEHGTN